MDTSISNNIKYIGVDDLELDLFESQYIIPEGMAYNSYLINDDKVTIMDSVDCRKTAEWLNNLEQTLNGKTPDYLVILHCEPDHSSSAVELLNKYPNCKLVTSAKALPLLKQFYNHFDFDSRFLEVKENEVLSLGKHTLTFLSAPMVHWPEVMVAYENSEQILFSADAFGKFGALVNETDDWACEARRYYFNICGKYGVQVQNLIKKLTNLNIQTICPLHGPILKENLDYYLNLYNIWSKYEAETKGVFIAHATLHGNTAKAAEKLAKTLEQRGVKVAISDLCRCDIAEAIEDAFRYDRMVLAAPTYDAGIMPKMEDFIAHLQSKGYKNRTVGFIENGSWAPVSGKLMKAKMETLKDITFCNQVVTIKSSLNSNSEAQIIALADELTR
ncbi:MAG: FprA family A-type flavoprotein [Paludibacteraceae bacterium]|nr:FprA family A-type flavoprotein [Paludibacteraceae bacterium]